MLLYFMNKDGIHLYCNFTTYKTYTLCSLHWRFMMKTVWYFGPPCITSTFIAKRYTLLN